MSQQELEDRIFDAFIEEALGDVTPPDLCAQILAVIEAESSNGVISAVGRSTPATEIQSAVTKRTIEPAKQSDRRSWFIWAASVSAGLLLSVVVWQALRQRSANHELPSVIPSVIDLAGNAPTSKRDIKQAKVDEPPVASHASPASSTAIATDVVVPPGFQLDSELAAPVASVAGVERPDVTQPVADDVVVAELDRMMAELWKSMDVQPSAKYQPAELAQRASQVLTGYTLSDSEIADFANSENQDSDFRALITSATGSMAFDRVWSQRFVQQWFGHSVRRTEEESLVDALASQMRADGRWNLVISEMLGGSLENQDGLANQFVGLFAGGENHRLVQCVGTNFLNRQVACMRCHRFPDGANTDAGQQSVYWSLVAAFKGIESHGSGQLAVDRQSEIFGKTGRDSEEPGVYYEQPNGTLKQAFAQLPNGKRWQDQDPSSPRKALANWIASSSEFNQATVNAVWGIVFGRPLMPQVIAIDAVALKQRQEILQFLAGRFEQADHRVETLVGWLVSSRAFAGQMTELTESQWQSLAADELDRWQLAQLVFASGATPERADPRQQLKNKLDYVVYWRNKQSPRATLAQPSLQPGPKQNSSKSVPQFDADFVVHGLRHTSAEIRFVERILKAEKLDWNDRVQHVLTLSGTPVNEELQYLSKELLELHAGEAKPALLDLLWAVQSATL